MPVALGHCTVVKNCRCGRRRNRFLRLFKYWSVGVEGHGWSRQAFGGPVKNSRILGKIWPPQRQAVSKFQSPVKVVWRMETPATMKVEDLALLWLVIEQVQLSVGATERAFLIQQMGHSSLPATP